MKNFAKGLFTGIVVSAIFVVMVVKTGIPALQPTLDNNGVMYEKIDLIFHQLYNNSDIVQRFSHYTDDHSVSKMFCPECSEAEMYDIKSEIAKNDFTGEDVYPTFQQINEDSEDMISSLTRIEQSLANQYHALNHTYKRLKETNEDE